MASIEKRQTKQGVRYRARITLKGQPRLSETFSTRREALRWAERTTEALRSHRFNPESEAEQRTVGDLVDRYIREKLPQFAHPKQNRRKLNWWRGQLGEDTRLSQITPALIAAARDRLAAGQSLSGKKPSPSTVRRYLNALGGMMGTATREWFWLDSNPCTRVVRPSEPRGRVRCLDADERQRLLSACEDSEERRLYPLVVMALCTGARQGELLNLTWQDVDFERGLAILHHTKNGERRASLWLVLFGSLGDEIGRHSRDVGGVLATQPMEEIRNETARSEVPENRAPALRRVPAPLYRRQPPLADLPPEDQRV